MEEQLIDWNQVDQDVQQQEQASSDLTIPEIETPSGEQQLQEPAGLDLTIPELEQSSETASQPDVSVTVTEDQPKEGKGFFGTIADMAKGALGGVTAAVQNTKDGVQDLGFSVLAPLKQLITGKSSEEIAADVEQAKDSNFTLPQLDPDTELGSLTKSVSQTVTGFLSGGRILKSFKLLQGAGTAMTAVRGATAGGLGDFFAFDAHEKRLSNFINDLGGSNVPVLGALTDFMAADENDGEVEGRLKNVLEGVMAGGAIESTVAILKHAKRVPGLLKSGGEQAVADDLVDTASQLEVLENYDATLKDELRLKSELDSGSATPEQYAEAVSKRTEAQKSWENLVASNKDKLSTDINTVKDTSNDNILDSLLSPKVVKNADGSSTVEAGIKMGSESTAPAEDAITAYKNALMSNLEKGIDNSKPPENFINLDKIVEEGNAREALQALWQAREEVDVAFKASQPESWARMQVNAANQFKEEVLDEARLKGKDAQQLMSDLLSESGDDLVKARYRLEAGRDLEVIAAKRIATLAQKWKNGLATPEDLELFKKYVNLIKEATPGTTALKSEFARGLRSAGKTADGKTLSDTIDTFSEDEALEVMLQRVNMAYNPYQWRKIAKAGFNTTLEYFYNNILSGPTTHIVNGISNTLMVGDSILSKTVGGAVTLNPAQAREGIDTFLSLRKFVWDSVKLSAKSFWNSENYLRGVPSTMDYQPAKGIASGTWREQFEGLGIDPDTHWLTRGIDFLGNAYKWPSRLLGASDEGFLNLGYRSIGFAKALREGRSQGLSGEALAKFADEQFSTLMEKSGRATNDELLQEAARNTFTTDLDNSTLVQSVGKTVQYAVSKFPLLRIVTPFTRVATNLTQETFDHTVFSLLQKKTREALAAGGDARGQAVGRIVAGSTYATAAAAWAADGFITGRGPVDMKTRKAIESEGWKPYSFVFKKPDGSKEYVPYNRIEPFSSILGMSADMADLSGHVGELDMMQLAGQFSDAIGQNLSNKQYLKAFSDFMVQMEEAKDNGGAGKALTNWLAGRASGFVPYSSLLNASKDDPYMRETRNTVEKFFSRIPELSKSVDARVNLWGEPIQTPAGIAPIELGTFLNAAESYLNPFQRSVSKEEPITVELRRLAMDSGYKIAPPSDKEGNLDLVQFRNAEGMSAGSYRRRALADIKLSGKTFKEAMNDMVSSDVYKEATDATVIRYQFGKNTYKGLKTDLLDSDWGLNLDPF